MKDVGHPLEASRSPRVPGVPSAALRGIVVGEYAGFTEATSPSGGFVLPATTTVPVIVKIEDSPLRPPVFVNGPHDSFMTVAGECAPTYLEFRLAPLGAYRVFGGLPLDELPDEPLDLVDVLGSEGRLLGERVRAVTSWRQRFALVDRFLLENVDRGPRPAPEISRVWAMLAESSGQEPIRNLAVESGWSHKHLITKFKQQVGVAPKTAARLIRFDVVRRHVAEGNFGWSRIAVEAGYADQSHLVREVRQFTGGTPSAMWSGMRTGQIPSRLRQPGFVP